MATTKDDIRRWFRHGVASGHCFLIVVCDTFDWEDYDRYANSHEEARAIVKEPGQMQKVMEVYDLSMGMENQIAEHRAWHL